MGQDRDCIVKGAAISDVDRDFTGHVGGKEAVLQLFIEGAAGFALDRPVLGHFVPADLHHYSTGIKLLSISRGEGGPARR